MNDINHSGMSDVERAHWQTKLEGRADELRAQMRFSDAQDGEAASAPSQALNVQDQVDIADERLLDGLRYAESERDVGELRAIAAARERLDAGNFGLCVSCQKEIPRARLDALPASARCVECQARYEAQHPVEVRLPAQL